MKAQNKSNNSKSVRKNNNAALASSEWYQQFVRFVELRNIAPRTRETYLSWVRRLHEFKSGRDVTTLAEGEVLDFLIALRHERGLKDSTINQAACALRGFYRDHLGRDWKAWSKIKIRREEQLPNVLSRERKPSSPSPWERAPASCGLPPDKRQPAVRKTSSPRPASVKPLPLHLPHGFCSSGAKPMASAHTPRPHAAPPVPATR